MSMFNPDEVRRSTRTIMGIRTVPPDAKPGQVLTILPDRTFGWATAPVNTGPRGFAGADGVPGKDGTPGAPGTNGTNGQPGKDGAPGSNGLDGLSAYQVARANGYGGTQAQWLASLVGAPGQKGDRGDAGSPGADGKQGIQGIQGIQGVPGLLAIDYRDGIAVPAITSLLGLSASVDVAVTWNTAFTDTTYVIIKPQVSAASASLIGKTDAVVKSGSITKTGCVVTVTSTAILATGACTLGVLAFKKG